MIYYLGIDFGKKGAFALMDANYEILLREAMPLGVDNQISLYDTESIMARVKSEIKDQPLHVVGEKLHAICGSSSKATFTFGSDYGLVQGLIYNWFGKVKLVRAVDWQKDMYNKYAPREVRKSNGKRDTKIMALDTCLALYPDVDLRKNPRCRIAHDGIVDAILIARYGAENIGAIDDE